MRGENPFLSAQPPVYLPAGIDLSLSLSLSLSAARPVPPRRRTCPPDRPTDHPFTRPPALPLPLDTWVRTAPPRRDTSQNVPLRTFVTTPARRRSQPARDASQKGLALYRRLRADHQAMRQELCVDHQAMRQELREGYREMTQKLHADHREMFKGATQTHWLG